MMKSTKMLPSALLASVVLAVALSAQTNPDNPKFSLTIKADKPEVSLGSEIVFGITTTNLSDGPLVFDFGHQGGIPIGYQYDVRYEQGAQVARYEKERTVQLPNGGTWHIPSPNVSKRIGGIQPGKSIEQGAIISEIYPFDRPGRYTIQVYRKESWMPSPIYSNIITITVLPAANEPSAEEPPPAQ